jgi:hypothetical protein
VIFDQVSHGKSSLEVMRFLNADLQMYPKRQRKYLGRPASASKWSTVHIGQIIWKDFYFDGIVRPTKSSNKEPVETHILLFTKELVMRARRERSSRMLKNSLF